MAPPEQLRSHLRSHSFVQKLPAPLQVPVQSASFWHPRVHRDPPALQSMLHVELS